jgi:hypothetical protein
VGSLARFSHDINYENRFQWEQPNYKYYVMKIIFALLIVLVAGCSDQKKDNAEKAHRSHAQASLENLVDSFKTEYNATSSQAGKEMTTSRFRKKIDHFLSTHYLNHMHVHVDSVVADRLTIVTRFHTKENLAFRSSMEFKKPMPPKEADLYQFIQSLKINTDTSIDFGYVGKYELNYPDESSEPALIIWAFPQSYQVHGHR